MNYFNLTQNQQKILNFYLMVVRYVCSQVVFKDDLKNPDWSLKIDYDPSNARWINLEFPEGVSLDTEQLGQLTILAIKLEIEFCIFIDVAGARVKFFTKNRLEALKNWREQRFYKKTEAIFDEVCNYFKIERK